MGLWILGDPSLRLKNGSARDDAISAQELCALDDDIRALLTDSAGKDRGDVVVVDELESRVDRENFGEWHL